jgi:Uma2 family endonuclease
VARILPRQGDWSESDYLSLDGNHLVEFTDGFIEVLPMPTTWHQQIVAFLYLALHAFVERKRLGQVLFSPLPVRLRAGKYREPDIIFMRSKHRARVEEQYWQGADLVMEVVSKESEGRKRDLKEKPQDYANAGIPEYWIVDPKLQQITVLYLKGGKYAVHGKFERGDEALSRLLKGFGVKVDDVFKRRR